MGLFVQPYKCLAWAPSSLPPRFVPPIEFYCSFGGIKILGIPFGFVSFTLFFFFAQGFRQGCSTCKCVPKIRGHPGGFYYPLSMFHLKAFLFRFVVSPPFQVFKVSLPLFIPPCGEFFSGGIGLISLENIASTTYLGSWALVTHVITSKFLLDSCIFLLETIGANNSGPLPFQAHLKLMRKFFPLGSTTCVPLFEQLANKT